MDTKRGRHYRATLYAFAKLLHPSKTRVSRTAGALAKRLHVTRATVYTRAADLSNLLGLRVTRDEVTRYGKRGPQAHAFRVC